MIQQYSKTVLEHFKNPRNMGEIENPDGIGEIGNPSCGDVMKVYIKVNKGEKGKEYLEEVKFQTFGCLPPKEKVNQEEGWKPISEFSKGDKVFNRKQESVRIKQIYKNSFSGSLLKIIPFISKFNGFYVTPTHPVLCIKRRFLQNKRKSGNKCDWLRVEEKELKQSKPYYVESGLLEEGDYLVFPKLKEIEDNKKFTIDIMRLSGYYLSEGYITAKDSVLNFAFNKNEKEYIEEVKDLIKKITGKEAKQRIRNNVCEVYFCSRKWCKFFEEHFGKLAKNKSLSETIIKLPFRKQWEMIETYIYGDGNIYKRRREDTMTYRADTVSENLAIQLQRILTKGGIISSIKKYKKLSTIIEGRKLKPFTIFNLSFKLDKKHKFAKETRDYFLIPIKKIQKEKFKGMVYNIEVFGKDHSYLTRGFVVHNCAAAIASSSMTTQIAKGKTLEEAEKMTMNNVIEELGELPKIKMHCSSMAIQGLRKAIKNYKGEDKEENTLQK